jgi:hypothetical protein
VGYTIPTKTMLAIKPENHKKNPVLSDRIFCFPGFEPTHLHHVFVFYSTDTTGGNRGV